MKVLKTAGWLVLFFAVGIAGVLVGTRARDRMNPDPAANLPIELARHEIALSEPFPDVPLRDATGQTHSSADLARGSVVLFLDLDCSPCTDLAWRWQAALDEGVIEPGQVWGVCYYPRADIDAYLGDHELALPIYQDSLQIFHSQYQVELFPMAVTVGNSGLVRDVSFDSVSPIDVEALRDRLDR